MKAGQTSEPIVDNNSDYQLETISNVSTSSSYDEEIQNCGAVVAHHQDGSDPAVFGNISVANSSDVHFGNKVVYQGPVTIKQIVYDNNDKKSISDGVNLDVTKVVANGCDNPGFLFDNSDVKRKFGNVNGGNLDNSGKGALWLQNHKFAVCLSLITLVIVIITMVVLLAVLMTKPSTIPNSAHEVVDESDINTPVDSSGDNGITSSGVTKLRILSRLEWLAVPVKDSLSKLKLPVPLVIISHTATESCSTSTKCKIQAQYIQKYHMESFHWSDVGYNFMIGEDGFVYEGRGWYLVGAHTLNYNVKSIGIAFIGTWNYTKPNRKALTAGKLLIEKGVELGVISKDYKLIGARQVRSTESPGYALFTNMKTWPHFTEQL